MKKKSKNKFVQWKPLVPFRLGILMATVVCMGSFVICFVFYKILQVLLVPEHVSINAVLFCFFFIPIIVQFRFLLASSYLVVDSSVYELVDVESARLTPVS